MKRCSKCVTPDTYPGVIIDDFGICSHCKEYEKQTEWWESTREHRKRALEHLIERARSKSRYYDALIGLSGGKDSTYVLYIATRVYKLKVLCYNFDNGFQTDIAKINIQKAVKATGADLVIFRPNHDLMMRLYKHFYEHTGLFCPVCMRGIYAGAFSLVKQYRIPLSLGGGSKRTEERVVPEMFQAGDLSFFNNVLKEYPFPEDIRILGYERTAVEKLFRGLFILTKGRISVGCTKIQLPDYLDWNYSEIYEAIHELGWQSLPDRDEHVDCAADPIVHYQRQLQIPDLTYNTLKYSAMIRSGQMDREEALRLVMAETENEVPTDLDGFLDMLSMTRGEFYLHMEKRIRMKHMAYQKESIIMRAFRSLVKG